MINYTVKAKKNPVDASVKFYPQIGKQKATDLEEIAKEISVMCTLSLPTSCRCSLPRRKRWRTC